MKMTEAIIKEAAAIIKKGGVVAYPTETVYGLGANALSESCITKVYQIKKRSPSEPISLAVSSYEMIAKIAYVDNWKLIQKLLPGPFTVLLRKKPVVPSLLTANSQLVGVRYPDHSIAQKLIDSIGLPITATSANISDEEAPVKSEEVEVEADMVIPGFCIHGVPSTVVNLVHMKVIREGPGNIRLEELR